MNIGFTNIVASVYQRCFTILEAITGDIAVPSADLSQYRHVLYYIAKTPFVAALCLYAAQAGTLRLSIEYTGDTVSVRPSHSETEGAIILCSFPELGNPPHAEWQVEKATSANLAGPISISTLVTSQRFYSAFYVPHEQMSLLTPVTSVVRSFQDPFPVQGHDCLWHLRLRSPLIAHMGIERLAGLISTTVLTNVSTGLSLSLVDSGHEVLTSGEADLLVAVSQASDGPATGTVAVTVGSVAETLTSVTLSTRPPVWAYVSSATSQLFVRSHFSELHDVVLMGQVGTNGNCIYNQTGAVLIPRTNSYNVSGLTAHSLGILSGFDTTPPIGTIECGLIGGNHGYTSYLLRTSEAAGTRLGANYTDSKGDEYVVTTVDGNGIVLAPVPMLAGSSWHCGVINAGSTLTATDDPVKPTLATTNVVESQIYPVCRNVDIHFFADGIELKADAGVFCTNVLCRMSYELVDPSTVNVLTTPVDFSAGETWATFYYEFQYSDFGNVVINQRNDIERPMRLVRLGGIQCLPLSRYTSKLNRWLVVPNTRAYSGLDLSVPLLFNDLPTSISIDRSYLDNSKEPPSRIIEFLSDESGYCPVAYSYGYIPRADGSSENRLQRCNSFVRFKGSSLKAYPNLIDSSIGLLTHTNFEATCFTQIYLPQLGCAEATSVAWRKAGDVYRVEADFCRPISSTVLHVPTYLSGRVCWVEAITEGCSAALSGIVGQDGIAISMNGLKGYCVLQVDAANNLPGLAR